MSGEPSRVPQRLLVDMIRGVVICVAVFVVACADAGSDGTAPSSKVADTTTTSTTTSATTTTPLGDLGLPFEVEDATVPRPIPPDLATSADWTELDRGPLDPRWPGVVAWTGEEIVIWGGEQRGGGRALAGGAAYNPETDSWRMLAEAPLGAVSEPAWVWTGDELIVWDYETAAAWDPDDNTWREIEIWPLSPSFYRRAVWTGDVILDVNSGLAVDPNTGASRSIAEPPGFQKRASVVWADGYVAAVTSDGIYNLASDSWTDMPDSGLTPLATAGTWTGSEVVAVDYEMNAAVYNPYTNTWSGLPELPLRFGECFPRVHTFQARPIVEHCAGIGVWDSDNQLWTPLAYPNVTDIHTPSLIAADDHLYAWGSSFYRLETQSVSQPHRLVVGISYLDRPDDWTVVSVNGGPTIQVELISADGDACTIRAIHADARATIHSYLDEDAVEAQFTPHVGGSPLNAVRIDPGAFDEFHHLIWAQGTTDVIDLACETEEAVTHIAVRIWSPWQ